MSVLVALKVFCDLTLAASAAAVVIPWFSLVPGNFLPAMCCCAAGVFFACAARRKGMLRFLGAVPCLWAVSFCQNGADAVVVIPMAAYCLWLIAREAFTISYDAYRDFFKTGAIFHGACFLFASVNVDWLAMLPYAALYFLGAVFLLRNLRLGAAGSGRSMVLNMVSVVMTLVLGLVLGFAVYAALVLLRYPAATVYFAFMDAFFEIFREAVYFVAEVLTAIAMYIASLLFGGRGGEVNAEGSGNGEAPTEPTAPVEPNEAVNLIAGAILILLAAAAVFFLARKAAGAMKKRRGGTGRRVTTERIGVLGDQRGAKVTGNRARVRSVYRKFLRLVIERGEEIRADHTSEDVLHLSSLVADGRECAALREVYLAARYDTTREVTHEQVKEARERYSRLKDDRA